MLRIHLSHCFLRDLFVESGKQWLVKSIEVHQAKFFQPFISICRGWRQLFHLICIPGIFKHTLKTSFCSRGKDPSSEKVTPEGAIFIPTHTGNY
ncbi:hypothetical protein CEXT_43851 [Caerostris extrusa]|uniref:Uncharacterized protein n=1 Tax=Caerostris extrusa TaxID=172846 RepID=A0AAV4Y1F4_CAEEX|nr:hypothetical protein CEXT_43851 [Caerostris extrusa]